MKKGKNAAAAYIQSECCRTSVPETLKTLLDFLLDPLKDIDNWDTIEWCKRLMAGPLEELTSAEYMSTNLEALKSTILLSQHNMESVIEHYGTFKHSAERALVKLTTPRIACKDDLSLHIEKVLIHTFEHENEHRDIDADKLYKAGCIMNFLGLALAHRTEASLFINPVQEAVVHFRVYTALTDVFRNFQSFPQSLEDRRLHMHALYLFRTGQPILAFNILKRIAYGKNEPAGFCHLTNAANLTRFLETGDNLSVILNNNAACCYLAVGKPFVATWFLNMANDECENHLYKNKENLPLAGWAASLNNEIQYNLALTCFLSKKYFMTFYTAWQLTQHAYKRNSRLWLLLAHCCIKLKPGMDSAYPHVKEFVQSGYDEFKPVCCTTGNPIPFSPGSTPPVPCTAFGLLCICRALQIIKEDFNNDTKVLMVLPCPPIRGDLAMRRLLARILICGAYLGLVERKYRFAMECSVRVLEFTEARIHWDMARKYYAMANGEIQTRTLNLK